MASSSPLMEAQPESNIYIPDEWSEAANTIAYDSITHPPPVAFICGAKNSGKTTFSRLLLNVLLQRYKRVAYLDTDVGQTEFTPPGCISLTILDEVTPDLAVPCLKTPDRSYFFGDISSKRDPQMYLACIVALYDHYRREYCILRSTDTLINKGMPLVINTPGWVKGIGYDILVYMLKKIVPSHVVKIQISAERKNLPSGAFWLEEDHNVSTLIEINSARQDSFNRSVLVQKDARLLRDLRIMAYFRQCFPSDMNITAIKELARALAAHPPYELSISSVKIKHVHCEVPSTEIFYSLNATIVGLGIESEGSEHLSRCVGLGIEYEGSEHLSRCVGLGIVRGIDTFKRVLYLITPVPQNVLENVDILLQGFIQIPTCLLQVQGCVSPYMASNALSEN